MTKKREKRDLGIRLKPTDLTVNPHGADGEISVDSNDNKLKARLNGSDKSVVTEDQAQTITNKSIDADNNTVSNIEVDNLKAGVLNTDLSGAATDTEIPSALAVKNALEGQNEASEISYDNSTSGLTATDVQAAIDEVEGRVEITEGIATGADGKIDDHIADATDAHDASAISNAPSGNLAASNVQDALNEIQTEVDGKADSSEITDHINDAVGAHAASAISNTPSGNLAASDVQSALDELQSDIDNRALDSDLTDHENATAAHGATGAVVGTTNAQTLINKTLDGASIEDPIRSDTKKDTQANLETYALTATNGQLCFATDTKLMYQVVDNALTPVGGGDSGINYITNSTFDVDASDWVGDTNLTIARSTTNPLRGAGSGLISKAAVDATDETVSIPFTIEKADLAQKLYISFDKDASDANYADGDLRIEVVKDPNGTPVTIVCNADDILGGKGTQLTWFQTDAAITEYELVIRCNSTNASAYDVKIDNVRIAPRDVAYGTALETVNYQIRQQGSSLTNNGSEVEFNLGSASIIDNSKGYIVAEDDAANTRTKFNILSNGSLIIQWNHYTGNTSYPIIIHYNEAGTLINTYNGGSDASATQVDLVVNIPVSSGDFITVSSTAGVRAALNEAFVTIGLTRYIDTIMSEDIGNRDVVVEAAGNSGAVVADGGAINFTVIDDTTGSFDGTTFTAPETGIYILDGQIVITTVIQRFFSIYKDTGSGYVDYRSINENDTSNIPKINCTLKLNKGDKIQIRLRNGAATLQNSTVSHWLFITKRANPQTILETATVAARYTSDSGQTVNNGDVIVYEDVDSDTHNSYNSSTGKYIVPASGYYIAKASMRSTSAVALYIRVDEVVVEADFYAGSDAGSTNVILITYLEKGQVLDIVNGGSTRTLVADSKYNTFSIAKIK